MRRPTQRVYYGWVVLAAISSLNFANAATTIGVLTVFIIPLTDEFGWTRTEISAATSIGALLGAAVSPFAGRMTDRFGARIPLSVGALLIVIAMLNLAAMQTLLWFYAAFTLARLADQGLIQAPSSPAIAKWFVRYRGRAISAMLLASSSGGVVLPLLVQFVIFAFQWRTAWLTLGGIMLVLGLVPVLLLVRRQPEDMGLSIDGVPDRSSRESVTDHSEPAAMESHDDRDSIRGVGDALKSPALWLLTATVFLVGIGNTGISLHLVPFLVDSGINSTAAVGAVSVNFLSSAVSTLVWGYFADKFSSRLMLTFTLIIRTLSIALLLTTDTIAEAYAFSIIQGVTEAGIRTLIVVMLADYFGRQNLGSFFGINRTAQVTGFALGPLISGIVFDSTGSYLTAFIWFLILAAIGTFLVSIAKSPSKGTGDT